MRSRVPRLPSFRQRSRTAHPNPDTHIDIHFRLGGLDTQTHLLMSGTGYPSHVPSMWGLSDNPEVIGGLPRGNRSWLVFTFPFPPHNSNNYGRNVPSECPGLDHVPSRPGSARTSYEPRPRGSVTFVRQNASVIPFRIF